ncbi:hypothetical protein BKA82DRAFT_4012278 [Pisolithus tinctorius]|nr:hypothetical protein BKA82DRAFT_4018783 [Pisolithus tinctorius]KAI6151507.1 hypothetical protein BKA82DRAFT_4012278 [Pisolithus tinctorius]
MHADHVHCHSVGLGFIIGLKVSGVMFGLAQVGGVMQRWWQLVSGVMPGGGGGGGGGWMDADYVHCCSVGLGFIGTGMSGVIAGGGGGLPVCITMDAGAGFTLIKFDAFIGTICQYCVDGCMCTFYAYHFDPFVPNHIYQHVSYIIPGMLSLATPTISSMKCVVEHGIGTLLVLENLYFLLQAKTGRTLAQDFTLSVKEYQTSVVQANVHKLIEAAFEEHGENVEILCPILQRGGSRK